MWPKTRRTSSTFSCDIAVQYPVDLGSANGEAQLSRPPTVPLLPRGDQSSVTAVQSVTYVAGPVAVQMMLTVVPRNGATSSGVNLTSALPLPVALVSIMAVGIGTLVPVQS